MLHYLEIRSVHRFSMRSIDTIVGIQFVDSKRQHCFIFREGQTVKVTLNLYEYRQNER